MVDGRANDRKPQRNIDAGDGVPASGDWIHLEAGQLCRNVPLVVVHGDDGVKATSACLHKDSVARQGAAGVDALFTCGGDGGTNLLLVFGAKQPAFAAVRIQPGDGDARRFDA